MKKIEISFTFVRGCISGTDTTTVDNNIQLTSRKNLLIGTMNVKSNIDSKNTLLSGVITNVQTQLNSKAPSNDAVLTGTITISGNISANGLINLQLKRVI
jgi:hypothetical protein